MTSEINGTAANITAIYPVTGSQIGLAFLGSIAIIVVVLGILNVIIRHESARRSFGELLRDDDWYPSLARFQFLVWTLIVSFAYLGIAILRLLAGVAAFPESPPVNILLLMGISVAVPIASGSISSIKYVTEKPKDRPSQLAPYVSMLMENNKLTLTRFQMFLWTWIGVIVYLGVLFIAAVATAKNVAALTLPDIDITLVVLMGLSQGAYLGGKLVAPSPMDIIEIQPKSGSVGQEIIIFGMGFGDISDVVWVDNDKLPAAAITKWSDNRIDLKLPDKYTAGTHSIKVAKGGSLSSSKDITIS
jgi:hypothetical protein